MPMRVIITSKKQQTKTGVHALWSAISIRFIPKNKLQKMQVKIQIESLSAAWDFEFKPNQNEIIGIVIRSAAGKNKGAAGYCIIKDKSVLLQGINAIKNLAENPEKSSLVILDGIYTTCTAIDDEENEYKCTFNSPEPNTRAAQIIDGLLVLVEIMTIDIPFLKDFDLFCNE
jgi:hypothetical protein